MLLGRHGNREGVSHFLQVSSLRFLGFENVPPSHFYVTYTGGMVRVHHSDLISLCHERESFLKKNEEHIRIKFRGRDHQGGNNLFHFNIINSLHIDLLYTLLSFLLAP